MGNTKEDKKLDFSIRHPILYTIVIYILSFFSVLVIMIAGGIAGISQNITIVLGRILVAVILLAVFRRLFPKENIFQGIPIGLPSLAFVIWNLVYNSMIKAQLISLRAVPGAVLEGLAPAMFEETIFRGIAISKMEQSGKKPMEILIITALLFGLLHLTNIGGMSLINALIQAGYAIVIGLVFGAVFIRSHDIITVILLHALIDTSNHLFVSGGSATPLLIGIFAVLMAVMAAYAVYLVASMEKKSGGAV